MMHQQLYLIMFSLFSDDADMLSFKACYRDSLRQIYIKIT